jgi:hypothetical protein
MNRREWVGHCQDLQDYADVQLGRQDSAFHVLQTPERSPERVRESGAFSKIDRELAAYYHTSRRSL